MKLADIDISDVAFAALWLLVFCIPWEEEFSVAQGIALSHVIGIAASVAGIMAALLTCRIRHPHHLHYLLLAFVVWMTASYAWSFAPDATATKATSCIQLLVMVWLIWQFAPSRLRQMQLITAYVLGSFVSEASVIYAFATHTGNNLGLADGRYTATGFDENELGVTLALGLVMSCYLVAQRAKPVSLWIVQIPLSMMCICLTGSRGGVLAMSVAVVMIPMALMKSKRRWLIVSSMIVLLAFAAAVVPATTWDRLATIQSEVSEGTLTNRTRIWTAGLDVFREHPLIGVGFGAFGESVYSRLDIVYVAHNSYLSILVELGIVGELIFLTVLGASFYLAATLPDTVRMAWLLLLTTWCVSVSSLTWEHRKPTWLLFGLLIAQSSAYSDGLATNFIRQSSSFVPLNSDGAFSSQT